MLLKSAILILLQTEVFSSLNKCSMGYSSASYLMPQEQSGSTLGLQESEVHKLCTEFILRKRLCLGQGLLTHPNLTSVHYLV